MANENKSTYSYSTLSKIRPTLNSTPQPEPVAHTPKDFLQI